MRQPLIASVVLHVALIALVVLGLPPSDRKLDIPASIPIEIVDIGEVTEAARVVQGDSKPEPPKPPVPEAKPTPPAPPPPDPVSEPPPPPPPPKAPEPPKVAQLPPPREPEPPKREPSPPPPPPPPPPDPTPQPVPKPPPPKVEPPKPEPPKPEPPKPEPPKPEPPKPEPPKPEPPKPQPAKPEPPKPEPPKPQPPKPAPEKTDPLASILKDVAKMKPAEQKADSKPSSQQSAAAQAAPSGPKNIAGPDRAFRPSGKAIDAIRGQVSKNWNFDPGRKDAGNMRVQLRIDVALDGTVVRADFEPETRARMGADSHFRSAAEAALRAVLRTQKLDLLSSEFTPDTYDKWRTIVFTFDPRDMF